MALLAALPGSLLAPPARAAPASPTFEASLQAGWRTSIDSSDRAPGFQAVAGGGELFVGVAWGWVGLAAGGRARAGSASGTSFVEAGGDLALQLLLGERVRLRLGADGGRGWSGPDSSWFLGGFAEGTLDVVQIRGGRAAVVFCLRIDVDDYLTDNPRFPLLSTGIGAGFGMRY